MLCATVIQLMAQKLVLNLAEREEAGYNGVTVPFSLTIHNRFLSAGTYSIMLRRVTFTSFGNTNFDATTPLSVTFIMIQCG